MGRRFAWFDGFGFEITELEVVGCLDSNKLLLSEGFRKKAGASRVSEIPFNKQNQATTPTRLC